MSRERHKTEDGNTRAPSDLARETLRLLAQRKLAPTPAHYSAIYHELAGSGGPPASRVAVDETAPEALPAPLRALLEQVARLVEFSQPALGEDDLRLKDEAARLVEACRACVEPDDVLALRTRMGNFNHRLAFVAEEQSALRTQLLSLLQRVFESLSALSVDNPWLNGQVELLIAAAHPPASLRRLADVERRLRDVIEKQAALMQRELAGREETRHLLAAFIERLADMADLSGEQTVRLERYAREIETAQDLGQVAGTLGELIELTRNLSQHSREVHQELDGMRQRVQSSNSELETLRTQLGEAAAASRHDPLTGALNRRGLDEALEREIARARRLGSTLSVALFDVDGFKAINDEFGHPVGDAALHHLTDVARSVMRPQDTLSRFGGEEFVVLLPDTPAAGAVEAIQRLQRALTRKLFLTGDSRLLITFSAGVTELRANEDPVQAIERADQGMFQAKRTGKNKVVAI